MANIPTNNGGQILTAGQSLTGSFFGFTVCSFSASILAQNAQSANFTGLKSTDGSNLISGSITSFPVGTTVWLNISSASLDPNSVPVIFYR